MNTRIDGLKHPLEILWPKTKENLSS